MVSRALRKIPLATLAALALTPAASALASASQVTIMQDDTHVVFVSDAERAATLDEMKALGADMVKIRVDWRSLASHGESDHKPRGFDADDPAEYRQKVFGAYDATVRAIAGRGMVPYLQLGGRAPEWASGGRATERPKAGEFRHFVRAVGTRYSGSFAPASGAPVPPHVSTFSIWTEPNLYSWLSPQYANGLAISPHMYRNLVRAASDGLDESGHSGEQLLIGELMPFARSSGVGTSKVRPIEFLRELACVNDKYQPYRGDAARVRGCTSFRPIPGTGLAYHAYALPAGPDVKSPHPDDASIRELGRVIRALDRLSEKHRLVADRITLWITEFGFQTKPPDPYQTPMKLVPAFLGESEWYAYRNPRVASYSQYPLIDDPLVGAGGGFQSGLRFSNGHKKHDVYHAFEVPLFVKRRADRVVEVFGGVRAGAPGDLVEVQSRLDKDKFKTLPGGEVTLGEHGYFDRVFTIDGAAKRDYRFRFEGGKSRTASVHR